MAPVPVLYIYITFSHLADAFYPKRRARDVQLSSIKLNVQMFVLECVISCVHACVHMLQYIIQWLLQSESISWEGYAAV